MVASALSSPHYNQVVEAHGIIGCVALVIFFPLGATLIRIVPGTKAWLIHGAVMLFALSLLTINVGTGIWQAYPFDIYHVIIGLLLFALAWIQPVTGLLHHYLYLKYSRRTIASFIHISVGRAIITLGMINGGLGMLLAGDPTRSEMIIYGIVAAMSWLTYFGVAFYYEDKREQRRATPRTDSEGGIVQYKMYSESR